MRRQNFETTGRFSILTPIAVTVSYAELRPRCRTQAYSLRVRPSERGHLDEVLKPENSTRQDNVCASKGRPACRIDQSGFRRSLIRWDSERIETTSIPNRPLRTVKRLSTRLPLSFPRRRDAPCNNPCFFTAQDVLFQCHPVHFPPLTILFPSPTH